MTEALQKVSAICFIRLASVGAPVKMLAIGLAKHKGAENLGDNIVRVAKVALKKLNIVGAVASIENGYSQLADVYVLKKEEILEKEPEILERARAMVPQLLLPDIDALIVTDFGRDISGNGMDPMVVGRQPRLKNLRPNVRTRAA